MTESCSLLGNSELWIILARLSLLGVYRFLLFFRCCFFTSLSSSQQIHDWFAHGCFHLHAQKSVYCTNLSYTILQIFLHTVSLLFGFCDIFSVLWHTNALQKVWISDSHFHIFWRRARLLYLLHFFWLATITKSLKCIMPFR